MNVHVIDSTYELFRHFFAAPSRRDAERLSRQLASFSTESTNS